MLYRTCFDALKMIASYYKSFRICVAVWNVIDYYFHVCHVLKGPSCVASASGEARVGRANTQI